ncbi:hypothetical protein ACCS78_02370, partial [Rhizobium johnstonii]
VERRHIGRDRFMIALRVLDDQRRDDFKLLMLMSLAVIPLVLLLRKPKAAPAVDHSAVME